LVRRWGYEVNVASDAASAERSAEADPPDVVLLDAGARQTHAWAVARRLRAHPAEKSPFLIVLADHRREIDRRAAGRVGVDLYLVKPTDTDLLEGVLRRFARIIRPAEVVPAGEASALVLV
jgi:DNA-binding response OmpR family regulator